MNESSVGGRLVVGVSERGRGSGDEGRGMYELLS